MRRLGVAALVLTTACSFSYQRAPITAASAQPSCSNGRPQVDSAAGAALIVGGAATSYMELTDSPMLLGGALIAAGGVFIASAVYGSRENGRCERELVARRAPASEPLHVDPPRVAMTCEQRRLDMYSRAVTGADQDQRVRLLTELPSCEERTERERAWVLTRMAALDAGAGRCAEIEHIAREVYTLDVVLHDVVLMSDIEIKHCLQLREL